MQYKNNVILFKLTLTLVSNFSILQLQYKYTKEDSIYKTINMHMHLPARKQTLSVTEWSPQTWASGQHLRHCPFLMHWIIQFV